MSSVTITGVAGRQIEVPTGLFIDNEFVPAAGHATIDLENPSTGAFLAKVSAAQASDVDRAVSSAQKAYNTAWRNSLPEQRRGLLNNLADLIERDSQILASLESVDAGILFRDSSGMFVPQAADTCRYYAGWADKLNGDSLTIPQGMAYTRREPFGVCAAIVPWNSPLMTTTWKLAPAIAAGNVLIIKTPELSPLYAQKLGQLIVEAGFPPGVVNILCGIGSVAGKRLAEHPDVHKLSFTGSGLVGREILAASARTNLKKVTLELGGKGPSIVFSDADIENALNWTVAGITVNNGQICAAGSRIYIQEDIYDRFIAEFSKMSQAAVAGDPLLETTTKGPLISGVQKDRVMGYIRKGQEQNVKLLHGGDAEPSPGHFVPNTAFFDVDSDAAIIREEIFGPVASIARFKTEEEVVGLANDTPYGLAAAVFTNDINKALRVSNAVECGQVTVNMWGTVNANTTFGGFKESGIGRDLGKEALEAWTQLKCVKINIFKL
ncbi:aldehyde dehydrogenase [Thozetella sp. PMI_491]|nr:aldehyde dehydrogenase [Thozetella sp. PMI_491]